MGNPQLQMQIANYICLVCHPNANCIISERALATLSCLSVLLNIIVFLAFFVCADQNITSILKICL